MDRGKEVMYSNFNYIPPNKHARKAAKKTLGYNQTRKGKDGVEIERKLFGKGGPLTREQVEWQIDNAPENTYFFRWKLSPDPKEENANKPLIFGSWCTTGFCGLRSA